MNENQYSDAFGIHNLSKVHKTAWSAHLEQQSYKELSKEQLNDNPER